MAGKKGRSGKLKYKSAAEMEMVINEYFEICKGDYLKDKDGNPILDKFGRPVIIDAEAPTVTGLALHLGFTSRLALLNYQGKAEFEDLITRAKSRVEKYTEGRLFDRDGARGAEFSLRNNFKGWSNNPKNDEADEALAKLDELITRIDNAAAQ